jgi:hypothetical protein
MIGMHKSFVKSLVIFPALSMVVALGCTSSTESIDSSVSDVSVRTDDSSPEVTSDKNTTGSSVGPKGAQSSGSNQVDSNGLPIGGTTTTSLVGTSRSTSTTVSTATSTTLALSVLERIVQENEMGSGYLRSLFRHWIDANGNRCNTREEVLIAESLTPAQVDAFGCKVVAGDWYSPFDGRSHTDPSNLDIDHLVPLKEAWDSGAHAWTSLQRERFANDLSDGRALIAVTSSVNRSKGDRDPSQWLPPRTAYVCTYISDWIAVKYQWNLSMDSSEWGRLKNLLNGQCAGTTIAPWGTG